MNHVLLGTRKVPRDDLGTAGIALFVPTVPFRPFRPVGLRPIASAAS
ncbi:MAG: hypothetical protein WD021_11185 [Rhodothermales bacterium]